MLPNTELLHHCVPPSLCPHRLHDYLGGKPRLSIYICRYFILAVHSLPALENNFLATLNIFYQVRLSVPCTKCLCKLKSMYNVQLFLHIILTYRHLVFLVSLDSQVNVCWTLLAAKCVLLLCKDGGFAAKLGTFLPSPPPQKRLLLPNPTNHAPSGPPVTWRWPFYWTDSRDVKSGRNC